MTAKNGGGGGGCGMFDLELKTTKYNWIFK
jgi:hypothetical protein